jgi:cyclopropane fatty-acyl-phospholipid synthase-like methyltransferase
VRGLDLNHDIVPEDWRSRFDLLINAGTTEHVVNHDNAFRVMHDLVKVGGFMIHEVPVAGFASWSTR